MRIHIRTSIKSPKLVIFMLSLFLVIFTIVATILLTNTMNDKKYYETTQAVITFIEKEVVEDYDDEGYYVEVYHYVYVDYEVDGVTYTDVEIPYYDMTMHEGKIITVTYDSRNPGVIINSAKSTIIISLVMYGACIILLVLDLITIKSYRQKKREEQEYIPSSSFGSSVGSGTQGSATSSYNSTSSTNHNSNPWDHNNNSHF